MSSSREAIFPKQTVPHDHIQASLFCYNTKGKKSKIAFPSFKTHIKLHYIHIVDIINGSR